MERPITSTCHSVVAGERQCEGARSHLMRHGVLWSKPQERRSARTTGNPDMLRAFAI